MSYLVHLSWYLASQAEYCKCWLMDHLGAEKGMSQAQEEFKLYIHFLTWKISIMQNISIFPPPPLSIMMTRRDSVICITPTWTSDIWSWNSTENESPPQKLRTSRREQVLQRNQESGICNIAHSCLQYKMGEYLCFLSLLNCPLWGQ